MRRSSTRLWAVGLLVFLSLLSYVPALRGGFVWGDDRALVYEAQEKYGQALREAEKARKLGQQVKDPYLERLREQVSEAQSGY